MLLLAIDTAGPDCAVALARPQAKGSAILVRMAETIGRGHAERLMPMVEAALAEARVDFDDLERIAVTTGPGSFTGVRVGIAAARGLSLALEIPAIGIGSLDALAFPFTRSRGAGTVVAALDAKRGEVYLLAEKIETGKRLVEAGAIGIGEIAARLRSAPRPLAVTGSGATLCASALGEDGVRIVGTAESPDIADVAALGLVADAAAPPAPLYLRGADARPQGDKALVRL